MNMLWNVITAIIAVIGTISSLSLFSSLGMNAGLITLLSTFFTSCITYSIGEYFRRNDITQEILKSIDQELKGLNQKESSYKGTNQKEPSQKGMIQKDTFPKDTFQKDISIIKHNAGQQPHTVNKDTKDGVTSVMPIKEDDKIICPVCNTIQPKGRNVCWECGTRFDSASDK